MTENKFDSAARLLRALQKLEEKRAEKHAAVRAQFDERRAGMLAAADPEVRAMVTEAES